MSGLILASASPRRRELLQSIAEFTVEPSLFEERAHGMSARQTAEYFVVAFEGEILGKPKEKQEAVSVLTRLSGKTHSVYTGVCLVGRGFCKTVSTETLVTFFPLDRELIVRYVESGLPLDKAGSYGIQDGYPLVRCYQGSYTGVVGLPVEEVCALLEEAEKYKC